MRLSRRKKKWLRKVGEINARREISKDYWRLLFKHMINFY